MHNTYTHFRSVFLSLLFILMLSAPLSAQPPKKAPAKGGAATAGKTAKGTLAADMDCLVKINKIAKPVSVLAYTPLDVTINAGENTIEATSSDKKSTFRKTVTAKPGETVIIEISFFDDAKFLDYVKTGSVSMIETALKKDPSLLNNDNGTLTSSPLEIALVNSQPEAVKFLINKGASFKKPEDIFPLHKSVLYMSGQKPKDKLVAPDREMVDFFMAKGCKINDKDDGGNTPLHVAVRAGKLDLVAYLVEKGADINAKNDFDDTPIIIAQNKGMISIINYLRSNGATEK
jgi:ankyrin repeat protein